MSDREKRERLFYIEDMMRFSQNVLEYTAGLDQAAFVADRVSHDATLRNLELIAAPGT